MPEKRRQTEPELEEGARARGFWSGTLAFGLVSIPVSLYVASRPQRVSFRMLAPDGTPLKRRYFCTRDEQPLENDDLVRGYEIEKDRYVIVDDEELTALAPAKSQEIDLKRFVPLDQIDPMYFERAYFLVPNKGAVKAYRLLARIMEDRARAGIATFVMRGKEYLVAIISEAGLLRAQTLRFPGELRTADDVGLPDSGKPETSKVRVFSAAIKSLEADELDRSELVDDLAARLQELVQKKLEAGADVIEAPAPQDEEESEGGAEIIDLMAILKESLGGGAREGGRRPPRQKQAERAGAERSGDGAKSKRSKAELYARAQELDVPGRSQMTKEQLEEAIRRAEG